jgi:hypothetical protein
MSPLIEHERLLEIAERKALAQRFVIRVDTASRVALAGWLIDLVEIGLVFPHR